MKSTILLAFLCTFISQIGIAQSKIISQDDFDTAPKIGKCPENVDSNECFQELINAHIQKTMDISGLVGSGSGTLKAYVQFEIEEDGKISNIRVNSLDKNMKREAERIIKKLKVQEAAKKDGEFISSKYVVPVLFNAIHTNDLNSFKSLSNIIPLEDAAKAPIILGCNNAKIQCFEKSINQSLMKAFKASEANPKEVKYYIEVNESGKVSTAIVNLSDKSLRENLEHTLEQIQISNPALSQNGKPISISYNGILTL